MLSLVGDSELVRYLASERASIDYCNEVVDGSGRLQYLDSIGSVSGLELERDPRALEVKNSELVRILHGF